jgi:hypothetical protein
VTLSIQWKGLDKLAKDLEKAKRTAVPYAIKTALNSQAYEARRIWQGEMRKDFTLRNQFTERSVMVVRAKGRGLEIQSSVGSTAPYMGEQEVEHESRGRAGLKGIPGPAAAGQAPGTKRTRLVRSANKLGAISVAHPTGGTTKKQRNAISIAMAVRKGKQVALLERAKGGKALFRIMGGRQVAKRRALSRRSLQLRMLWDFSKASYHVPAHPTLRRTLAALEPKVPSMWQAAIVDQFRRHHLFGF